MRLAVQDGVRGSHDATLFSLSIDGVEAGDFGRRRGHKVTEEVARANAGQLISVAHKKEMCTAGDRLEEAGGEARVEHAGLVEDEEVAGNRVVFVVGEAAGGRVVFEQTVDGAGGCAGSFRESLGGTARRGSEQHADALGAEDVDHGAEDGGFPGSRAAGNNRDLGCEGIAQGDCLLVGQFEASSRFCPLHRGVYFNRGEDRLGPSDAGDGLGDALLRTCSGGQLIGRPEGFLVLVTRLDAVEALHLTERSDALLNERGLEGEQLGGLFENHRLSAEGVAFVL